MIENRNILINKAISLYREKKIKKKVINKNINFEKFMHISDFLNSTNNTINYFFQFIKYKYKNIDIKYFLNIYNDIVEKNLRRDQFKFNKIFINNIKEYKFLEIKLQQNNLKFINILQHNTPLLDKIFMNKSKLIEKEKNLSQENYINIKQTLKTYIQIMINTEQNIDKYIKNLYDLSYNEIMFLCYFLRCYLEIKIYIYMEYIMHLYDNICEVYYLSVLNSKHSTDFNILEYLSILYADCIDFENKLSPANFANDIKCLNKSFFSYLSHKFIDSIQVINDNKFKWKNVKKKFKMKELKKLKNITNLMQVNNSNVVVSFLSSSLIWLWDLIRIDGINIFLIIEFLTYQLFYDNKNDINNILGNLIFQLKNSIVSILHDDNIIKD